MREASPADAGLISKLAAETFFETYAWYNTPENMRAYTEKHFSPQQTENELKEPFTRFFLCYHAGEAIGYAKLRAVEQPPGLEGKRHIEMERIYVKLAYQKKKAGHALMRTCVEYARGNNYEILWLGVWEKNPRAIAFYIKEGFAQFGEHDFVLGSDVQKDYLLKLDLT